MTLARINRAGEGGAGAETAAAPTGISSAPADAYYADLLGEQPSLSASICKLLLRSPAHARHEHPRLNPDYQRRESDLFDLGTTVHRVLLEGADPLDVVALCEYDSWRSKDAQAERDQARAAGKIPLLGKHLDEVCRMVDAVADQIAGHPALPALFGKGAPERTLTWHEPDGTFCKARVDWLHDDLSVIDDLKTTTASAEPGSWRRRMMFALGCDVQAAFYLRGLERLTGVAPRFRFIVAETAPPYAISVIEPSADTLAVGQAKVDHALKVWNECLASGSWPCYPQGVVLAEPPPWELRWLEAAVEEEAWAGF